MSDDFDQYKNQKMVDSIPKTYKWPLDAAPMTAYPSKPTGVYDAWADAKTKEVNDLRGRVATLERDIRDIKAKLFDIYNRG